MREFGALCLKLIEDIDYRIIEKYGDLATLEPALKEVLYQSIRNVDLDSENAEQNLVKLFNIYLATNYEEDCSDVIKENGLKVH